MAKRTLPKQQAKTAEPVKVCDDCGHGNWIDTHQNKDWQGNPICLTCPFNK